MAAANRGHAYPVSDLRHAMTLLIARIGPTAVSEVEHEALGIFGRLPPGCGVAYRFEGSAASLRNGDEASQADQAGETAAETGEAPGDAPATEEGDSASAEAATPDETEAAKPCSRKGPFNIQNRVVPPRLIDRPRRPAATPC